ncbi:hypothetical protein [Kutzneria sp. CA-103260]|uniref:hypothetical protein n=1 Tax=Kutzneria sp. CA-103260 TaxID=2802641 RepID=UPI001BA62B51|nr:hypothetical protein [Kutzneria sp. CA-103260]QUQ71341.1 hypothetical protein JJ691_91260 [Kutzneria sp. CA-103260]
MIGVPEPPAAGVATTGRRRTVLCGVPAWGLGVITGEGVGVHDVVVVGVGSEADGVD